MLLRVYSQDVQFQETLRFLESDQFEEVIMIIENTREFSAIAQYLDNANWPWIQRTIVEELRKIEAYGSKFTGKLL